MRWPLRNQLLLPAACLVLATLVAVSIANAWISARNTRLKIERELNQVAATLTDAAFPLSDNVLRKMRGLSGAEFVLTDHSGKVIAASSPERSFAGLLPEKPRSQSISAWDAPITLADGRFFLASLNVRRNDGTNQQATLHILYPEESYRDAWLNAVAPPLVVGAVAMLLVMVLGSGIASRVTRPLRRLQVQVDEIAQGDFRRMAIPSRDDEIADLSRSINHMSELLAEFESDVRRNEQLRTLGQLGAGIAHQIRNSVTGCRLAVELHARECPSPDADESLQVALRQLELMERYLRRFMSLGRNENKPHELTDLVPLVHNVVSLVRPTARHLSVELEWTDPAVPCYVNGDADALEQLLVNLSLNAVEAASHIELTAREFSTNAMDSSDGSESGRRPSDSGREGDNLIFNAGPPNPRHRGLVAVKVERHGEWFRLVVEDSGPGPSSQIKDTLFDPFVSEKRDGTGLGLAVAQEIVADHGGKITWQRHQSRTHFVVDLPAASAMTIDSNRPAPVNQQK